MGTDRSIDMCASVMDQDERGPSDLDLRAYDGSDALAAAREGN